MRSAFIIVAGNLLAFTLGVVVTLWATRIVIPALPLDSPSLTAMRSGSASSASNANHAPGRINRSGVAEAAVAPVPDAMSSTAASVGALPDALPAVTITDGSQAAPSASGAMVAAAQLQTPPAVAQTETDPPPTAPPPLPEAAVKASAPASSAPIETTAAEPVATAALPSSASNAGAYVLQLAAFRIPANATRMQTVLIKDGFTANVVPFNNNGKAWQLVQIGSFADRSSAAEAAVSLRRQTGLAALVMKPTPQ